MKRLSLVAIVVSLISLGLSGWAAWYAYDSSSSASSVTTDGATTTTADIVEVPTVVGKNGLGASQVLINAGLRASATRSPSIDVAKGDVISQSPQAGTEVPRGTMVRLTLSSGPSSG